MPLKLIAPEKTPGGVYYAVHGTYLGVRVRQSTGTDKPAVARAELRNIERRIEEGRFSAGPPPKVPTFADAVIGYLKNCPDAEVARVKRLLDYFHTTPLADFDLNKIEEGEEFFYPGRAEKYAGATMNREYRTPLASVLHDAAERKLVGWVKVPRHKERQVTKWLEPDVAWRLIEAAGEVDSKKKRHTNARLQPLLILLFTANMRISEACRPTWSDANMERRELRLTDTKNGESYTIHLGDLAFEAIANMPGRREPGLKIFGFRDRHAVKYSLAKACELVGLVHYDEKGNVIRDKNGRAKLTFTLHQARHSFATWMRRNGYDLKALQEIGRWKDIKSVARYAHVSADEHAPAIAALPLKKAGG